MMSGGDSPRSHCLSTTPHLPLVPATPAERVVGSEVATAPLAVAGRPEGSWWQVANDAQGIAPRMRQLQALAPTRVVREATGGCALAVAAALGAAGLVIALVNARQVRPF